MTLSSLAAAAVVDGVPFEVAEVAVSLDETRAPFAAATLTVPYDPDTVDLLDPRRTPLPRVTLRLERRFSGSVPLSDLSAEFAGQKLSGMSAAWAGLTLASLTARYGDVWNDSGFRSSQVITLDLGVRARTVDHAAETIVVDAASDEGLLTDYGLLATVGVSPVGLTVKDAVQLALARAVPGSNLITSEGAQVITAEAAVWAPGVSAWDYVEPLTTAANLRLWCDERRVWHLATPETIITPGQVTLAATGSVTGASDLISRDTVLWYDGVVVTYRWTDASNVRREQSDIAGDAAASRVLHVLEDRPYPRAGAASARLRKVMGQGRVLGIRAVADLTAYPAMAASLSVPDTPTQVGYVASVTWQLPADEMDVVTRGLLDVVATAWLAGQGGQSWSVIPAGLSWSAFTWSAVPIP